MREGHSGGRKSPSKLSASALRALLAAEPEGLKREFLAKKYDVHPQTIWRRMNEIKEARGRGEVWGSPSPHHETPDAPLPKRWEELSDEARAMLEDTPEGFERFFNAFAPESDPRIKALAPHSRMFIEAAYHRCANHPRRDDEGQGARPDDEGPASPPNLGGTTQDRTDARVLDALHGDNQFSGDRREKGELDAQPAGGAEEPGVLQAAGQGVLPGAQVRSVRGEDAAGEGADEAPVRDGWKRGCDPADPCHWQPAILLNVPPEHAKTTIFTIWFSCWRVTQSRAFKRVIISRTERRSHEWIDEIANILRFNEPLVKTFGAFFTDSARVRWRPSAGELRVAAPVGDPIIRGSNVVGFGMDGHISGLRADEMVLDDPIDEDSVRSEGGRQKSSTKFHGTVLSRALTGRTWVIGTRWHPLDLYSEMLAKQEEWEKAQEEHPDGSDPIWRHISFPALADPVTGEASLAANAVPLWDDEIAAKSLRIGYQRMGAAIFALVYQQTASGIEESLIKSDWVLGGPNHVGCVDHDRQTFVPGMVHYPPPREGYVRVAGFDPSPSNWAAIVVADVRLPDRATPEFHAEVVYVRRWRASSDNIATANAEFEYLGAGPGGLGVRYLIVEMNDHNKLYAQDAGFKQKMAVNSIRVIPHTTGRNKADPIWGLQTLARDFEFGRIRLPYVGPESVKQTKLLTDEGERYFPMAPAMSGTTDCLMALWFLKVNLMRLRDWGTPRPERPKTSWGAPGWVASSWKAGV